MLRELEHRNLIKLKTKLNYNFFVVVLCIILYILFKKPFIIILTLIYLSIFQNKNNLFLYIAFLILIIISFNKIKILGNYYYVDKLNNNYAICTNINNKIKLYDYSNLHYGDLIKVKFINYDYINSVSQNKKGIYYNVYDYEIIKKYHINSLRSILYTKIEDKNDILSDIVKKDLFGIYPDKSQDRLVMINISWNIFFISILSLLNKLFKHPYFNLMILSLGLFNLIGINYSSIRIVIIEVFNCLFKSNANGLALAAFMMLVINPNSIFSYRFILPFLIRLNFKINSPIKFNALIILIQSYFFGEVNLLENMMFRLFSMVKGIFLVFYTALCIADVNLSEILINDNVNIILNYINAFTIRGKVSFLLVILIFSLFKKYKLNNKYLQLFIVFLCLFSNISNIFAKVSFINVNQGDAILIKSSFNQDIILIDTGSEYNYYLLKKYLINEGIYEIDKLVITHGDDDHDGNIINLARDFNVKDIIIDHQDINLNNFKLISLNNNNYNNKNDNSLVHYFEIDGMSFLFTGDISKTVEEDIFANLYLNVDVLKLAHHGSNTSTSETILRNNHVKLGIISTNGRYGHPGKETIDTLDKYKIKYFSTKELADIEFIFTTFGKFIKCSRGDFVIIKE